MHCNMIGGMEKERPPGDVFVFEGQDGRVGCQYWKYTNSNSMMRTATNAIKLAPQIVASLTLL